jgi:predicted SpoU family rRNA methylase
VIQDVYMVRSTIVNFIKISAFEILLIDWRQENLIVFSTFFFRHVENLVQEMRTKLYLVIVGFAKIDAVRDVVCLEE